MEREGTLNIGFTPGMVVKSLDRTGDRMATCIIDEALFHEKVNATEFVKCKELYITPPQGEFVLMN